MKVMEVVIFDDKMWEELGFSIRTPSDWKPLLATVYLRRVGDSKNRSESRLPLHHSLFSIEGAYERQSRGRFSQDDCIILPPR